MAELRDTIVKNTNGLILPQDGNISAVGNDGAIRYNISRNSIEYSNGTIWILCSTGNSIR